MKKINDNLYINEDKVQSVKKIGDQYFLSTSFGSSINIPQEIFDDLKDYEGSGGGGGGGGDAELNIAYGLTPPSDTSKLWVRIENEPSAVKVEANRNLVASSNENAKIKITDTITETFLSSYNYAYMNNKMVKMGDDYYITTSGNSSGKFLTNNVNKYTILKYSNGSVSSFSDISTDYRFYSIFKYDSSHLLAIFSYGTTYYYRIYDITNGSYVDYSLQSSTQSNNCYYNNKVYGLYFGTSSYLDFKVYEIGGGYTPYQVNISDYTYISYPNIIYYNDYLYFIMNKTNNKTMLVRWKIASDSIEDVLELPRIIYNGSNYGWAYYTSMLYENKLIVGNVGIGDYRDSAVDNKIYLIDLINSTYETIELDTNYLYTYICVDEANGNIELWGGSTPTTLKTKKTVISNIYELTENTLSLYYDIYSSKNIRLLDSETLTMDAPINHAWLGDINNIAQPVDMYYYDNGTWKGINCEDYSG